MTCPNPELLPDLCQQWGEELTRSRWVFQLSGWKSCGGNKRQADNRARGVMRVKHGLLWNCTPPKSKQRWEGPSYTKPPRALDCWPNAPFIQKDSCLFTEHVVLPEPQLGPSLLWSNEVLRTHLSLVTDWNVPGTLYISPRHTSQKPYEARMVVFTSWRRKT